MANYRDLISEKEFLSVRRRARALPFGSDLIAILYKDRTLIFKTASGTYGKRVIWTQTIEITDALIENILAAKKFSDVETLVKESALRVDCNCPADLYWGYKYIRWKKGSGLKRELRRPMVRNPYQKGALCFAKGTRVLTEHGYRCIETIKPGDNVYTHKGRLKQVNSVSSRFAENIISIGYDKVKIICTSNHPFLACNSAKFQSSSLSWIPAGDLKVGNYLASPKVSVHPKSCNSITYTPKVITEIGLEEHQIVYNLDVQGDDSYIVEGVAVHNCKHLYLVLSLYPFWSKSLAKKFKDWADSKVKPAKVSKESDEQSTPQESNAKESDEQSTDELDFEDELD